MAPLPDNPQLPQTFGPRPSYGIAGCLGGTALVAIAIALAVAGIGNSRGMAKLIGALGIGGLIFLAVTFKVSGAEFRHDGVRVWWYIFWFLGTRRFIPAADIRALVLGEKGGHFTVTLKFADGTEHLLPLKWASVKDAQTVIDLGTQQYGAGAEVAIENQAVLVEAATFATARRFTVTPYKISRAEGERLPFKDAAGKVVGEIRLLLGWFQGGVGEISEGGGVDSTQPRWHLKNGSKVGVTDGTFEAKSVENKSSFTGSSRMLRWTDPNGTVWSAVFTTENDNRSPFTLKFYRGLAADVGSKSERETVSAKQGEAELGALANGEASSFTLDVANEQAWPWIRIALATVWMRFRPNFSYASI